MPFQEDQSSENDYLNKKGEINHGKNKQHLHGLHNQNNKVTLSSLRLKLENDQKFKNKQLHKDKKHINMNEPATEILDFEGYLYRA